MESQLNTDIYETIVAPATPNGRGGLGVVRLSGNKAITIADKLWRGRKPLADTAANTAVYGPVVDNGGEELDRCIVTLFRAPHSFTGEDTVEFSVHGSLWIIRRLVDSLIESGARMAKAGEFTQRAFLNGRLDLAQAEAVADLISSSSAAAHRLAMRQAGGRFSEKLDSLRQRMLSFVSMLELELDFSEEDVEFADRQQLLALAEEVKALVDRLASTYKAGKALKEGVPVVIAGSPNAGKSTLLNALLREEKAIVTDIPGTTRDAVEDTIELDGVLYRFIDTAGLRHTDDAIEQIGIERSRQAINRAVIVILVIDPAAPLDPDILAAASAPLAAVPRPGDLIALINKSDSATPQQLAATADTLQDFSQSPNFHILNASALTGEGIDSLRQTLVDIARREEGSADEGLLVTNLRHAQSLRAAAESTARVIAGLDANLSGDLIAQDLRQTIHHLSSITGAITTTDILSTIFSRFCIGK